MAQIIEYVIIVGIALGAIFGLTKGLIRVFFSWFSIVFGAIIALNFSYGLTDIFFPEHTNNVLAVFGIGVIVFSVVYLIFSSAATSFSQMIIGNNLSGLNYLLGFIFGAAQTMIFMGLIVYWLMRFNIVDMSPFPVAMFSLYWSERIILLFGLQSYIFRK